MENYKTFCDKLKLLLLDKFNISSSSSKNFINNFINKELNSIPNEKDLESLKNNLSNILNFINNIRNSNLKFSDIASVKIPTMIDQNNSSQYIIKNIYKQNLIIKNTINNLTFYMSMLLNDAKKRDFPVLPKTFTNLTFKDDILKVKDAHQLSNVKVQYLSIEVFYEINNLIKGGIYKDLIEHRNIIIKAVKYLNNIIEFILINHSSNRYNDNDINIIVNDIEVFISYIDNVILYLSSCNEAFKIIVNQLSVINDYIKEE